MTPQRIDLAQVLAAAENAAPMESLDVVARYLRDRFDAESVSFLFMDVIGRKVVRLSEQTAGRHAEPDDEIPLAGSDYDEVLRTQALVRRPDGDQALQRVLAPVTNRGDTIGVLELTLPRVDPEVLEQVAQAAHVLAYILITDRRFTDRYHGRRLTSPITLAAEIQRHLLPSAPSCEAAEFVLAGALVPADEIAGDTYDYTLDRDTLHVSITDAMGHDIDAALMATLLINASRGARRAGSGLAEQAHAVHQALLVHGRRSFATGLLMRVPLDGGPARLVNAGHPWPLLLRDGRVREVPLAVDMPLGLPEQGRYRVQEVDLRAGDRVVFYTDGMQERQAASVDLPLLIRDTEGEHPREVVRVLTAAVEEACRGHLQDDATVLCLDWHGAHPDGRHAHAGADLKKEGPSPV